MQRSGKPGRHCSMFMALLVGMITNATITVSTSAGGVDGAWNVPKQPASVTHDVLPLDRVARRVMPELNKKELVKEDDERALAGEPPRFAVPHPVRISPETAGTWEELDEATSLWRLRISSPNAVSINLGFTRYRMPHGAHLFLFAPEHDFSIRPSTSADNASHGEL